VGDGRTGSVYATAWENIFVGQSALFNTPNVVNMFAGVDVMGGVIATGVIVPAAPGTQVELAVKAIDDAKVVFNAVDP
jgi:hypothetical protein